MTAGVSGPHDLVWVILLIAKTILLFGFGLVMTLFMIMVDRKVLARMQVRLGPNRAGPNGWLQSLADGIKIFFKEAMIPKAADRVLFQFAPLVSVMTARVAISL